MTADDTSRDALIERVANGDTEAAIIYARTYWQFGNEPATQAALHLLRGEIEMLRIANGRLQLIVDNSHADADCIRDQSRAERDAAIKRAEAAEAEVERLQAEIGDAWEVVGHERSGAVTARVEFGPAGGPYAVVEEGGAPKTLAQFLASVEEGLEAIDRAASSRVEVAEAAHKALTEAVRALLADGIWPDEYGDPCLDPDDLRHILDEHGAGR